MGNRQRASRLGLGRRDHCRAATVAPARRDARCGRGADGGDDAFDAFGKVARERGKAWPDEHYRQVAEVYKSAVEHREPPLQAIQEQWHVSRPAAAKYVKGARERGFLGWPERAGLAGYDAPESPFTKYRASRSTGQT